MNAISRASIAERCGPGCPTCADLRRAAVALSASAGLDGVTPEGLAEVSGLRPERLGVHDCGAADTCLAAAYRETIEGMLSRYTACLQAAPTRGAGVRDATADLLAYLARHPDVASFVTVEAPKGGPRLAALREGLRRRSVGRLAEELARFDGVDVASERQLEQLVETMERTVARYVTAGEAAKLPGALDAVLATVGEPLLARR